jgi:outer membrane receptor protein involved in Fe transport
MSMAACWWLAAAMNFAQATGTTTGDLRGLVEDESGAALIGASVEAISPGNGFSRTAVSGNGGEFVLRFLPPGSYDVTASRTGFQTLRVAGVAIVVGTTASLRLILPVARVAETVSVGAASPSADLVATGLASTITQAEIRNLPINRRNFLDFALTTPGVTLDRGPQTGAAPTSGISINGQDPRLNNVQLDGLDDNDAAVGAFRSAVTQEAVLEYQVIRAPYAAEFGRAAGGVINVATRSGSNALAGTAFLFYRDQSLSASNAQTGTKTAYEQFQYGASLSGPILSDRLFFFAAAERLSVTDTNTFSISKEAFDAIGEKGFTFDTAPTSFDRGRTSVFAKLDAAPSPSQAWALRGNWGSESDENQQPWGAKVARSAGGRRDLEDAAVAITGISLFGAGASNELRLLAADRTHRLDSLDETGGPSVEIVGDATFGTQQFLPQPRDSRTYEVFEAVSFFGARITGKAGVDYVHTELQGSLPLYFAGRYEFSSLPAFEQDAPTLFMQGFGDPEREVTTDLFAAFAEAEWILGPKLVVRAGLRYDYERPADPFPSDSNNWAPRLSFSWAPSPTWLVRGGLGRFYAATPIAPMFVVGVQDGQTAQTRVWPWPDSQRPWGMVPDRRFGAEPDDGIPLVFSLGEYRSAYTDLASLGIQANLPRGWATSLDYVHARGQSILIEQPASVFERPYRSIGNTWYDAVTASVTTGVGGPLRVSASYTYAEAEDDYIDFTLGSLQDPLAPEEERGPTVHVPRHRAAAAVVYSTPSQGSWWSSNWTFSAISDVSIGRPYNVLAGYDRNGNGDTTSDRPEGVGRNSGTLPAFWNFDLRIGRRIPVAPIALEITLDVFNLFDRVNVLEVQNVRYENEGLVERGNYGDTVRFVDPRRLQLGLRISF